MLTDRDYQYFYEVAKCLNFTAAAGNLYISQPALSKQIARMEKELGFPLFLRNKQEVKLTPGGVVLLGEYQQVTGFYQNMLEKARQANDGKTGTLHIGIQDGQGFDPHILSLVQKFRVQHACIALELECLPYRQLLEGLQQGTLDVGLSLLLDKKDFRGMGQQKIRSMPNHLILSKQHPLASAGTLNLHAFEEETLFVVGNDLTSQEVHFMLEQCTRCHIQPRQVRTVDSYSTLSLWLSMGEGFTLLNQTICPTHQRLCSFPLPKEVQVAQFACWNLEHPNPAIPLFLETLS